MMKKVYLSLILLTLTACTTLGEIYDMYDFSPNIGKTNPIQVQQPTFTTPSYNTIPETTAPTANQGTPPTFLEIPSATKSKAAPTLKTTRTSQTKTIIRTAQSASASFQCGIKRTCSQMRSCREARYS